MDTVGMKKLEIEIKWRPALLVLAIFLVLWFAPCPEGLDPTGWKVLAVFLATIAGLLTKPMPMGAIVLLAITFLAAAKVLPTRDVLGGFGNGTAWLIAMALLISRAFIKTGFGNRISYMFIKRLGHTTLGLAYAISFSGYVMGPAAPSNTARTGGILMPLILAISKIYGSEPNSPSRRRMGSYLLFVTIQTSFVVCAAFLTAMGGNPLAVGLAAAAGVQLTWTTWAWGALLPSIVCMLGFPLIFYYIYPPEIKHSPEAREMAADKLKEMGSMTAPEKCMLFTFFLLLVMWVGGGVLGLNATIAAFIGVVFLLYCGVLSWNDIITESAAFDCLLWYSGVILLGSSLFKYGVIKWASGGVTALLSGVSWPVVLLFLLVVTMYGGYFIASSTAFLSATYATFLAIALAAGAPPLMAALALACFASTQACLTWYSSGICAIFFATGYFEEKEWLKYGFITSVLHLTLWLGSAVIWWKLIGWF